MDRCYLRFLVVDDVADAHDWASTLPAWSAQAVARAYAVVYRMTGSQADADDATREALLRVGRFDSDRLSRPTIRSAFNLRRPPPTTSASATT